MPLRRVLASLLLRGDRLVKGTRFANHRDAGDPCATVRALVAQGIDARALHGSLLPTRLAGLLRASFSEDKQTLELDLRDALYALGARDAGALAAQAESSLRSTDPTAPDLGGLGQAVTALVTAIRRTLSSPLARPRDTRAEASDTATPTAAAAPDPAALQSLLALLQVHDVKALECWRDLQPAIEARMGAGFGEPLGAAMAALDFAEAARLLRQLKAME